MAHQPPKSSHTDMEALRRSVRNSRIIVLATIALIFISYISYFGVKLDAALSTNPGSWGEFGDYVGGILNPIIAFFAFYWLSQSVLIQKEELADTKKALQDSAQIQLQQEKHAARTAQINALNTLLTSYDNDISNLRNNVEFVSNQLNNHIIWLMDGTATHQQEARENVGQLNQSLQIFLEKREILRNKISNLLAELPPNGQ